MMLEKKISPSPEALKPSRLDLISQTSFYKASHGKRFDNGIFQEALTTLDTEFKNADQETKKNILSARYFDALFRTLPDGKSIFEKEFAISIPTYDQKQYKPLGITGYGKLTTQSTLNQDSQSLVPQAKQYGPSLIIDVAPGEYVTVATLDEQDSIGSSLFTACAAVVVRSQTEIALAHVRMSDPEIIQAISNTHPNDDIYIIAPEKYPQESNKNSWLNQKLQLIKQKYPQINITRYPFIGSKSDHNPDDRTSTAVILGKNFVRQIGVQEKYGETKDKKRTLYFQTMPESIKDIDW